MWKINKQGPNRHFLFFKQKNTALLALYNLVASHLAAGGQRRLLWDWRAAETGFSACPMESGAAWTPPIHPIHVHIHQYDLSTVWGV
ncbi:hypothetical protein L2D08_10315 [Domibacillus sp. PGB-M46]|uniref:hypothetical protein n=1 Tax=Domibacillus sp. PGB-M46 TaxID=2910255 RepID=UPI001F57819A|nr:hypothetical protein [Domibacillus sp. PGB-M46]MCI2254757.1 hypothetical protein [Domibacillus sp. PGB-M46]